MLNVGSSGKFCPLFRLLWKARISHQFSLHVVIIIMMMMMVVVVVVSIIVIISLLVELFLFYLITCNTLLLCIMFLFYAFSRLID